MSPTISQTLFQSYSKILRHPTNHLLGDRRNFFLYALLYFRYYSRLRDENSAFEVKSKGLPQQAAVAQGVSGS